jgi:hypothetical protein
MKIVWNYIFILTGLCMLLQLSGIPIGGLSQLFRLIGISVNSTGIAAINSTPTFWTFLFGPDGILIAVGGGVIIGIFTRASPENFVILPFISVVLVIFTSAIYSIIGFSLISGSSGVLSKISAIVTVLIMMPFAISLIAALVDYFRGGDF